MDIKKIIEELIAKIKDDKDFGSKFKSDPVKAVESVVGIDLPDEKINEIIEGIKAKINLDELTEKAGGLGGIINKILNK
ncbi:hypothetical protein [Ruminococcus sp. XPD3002]|jgi:hypothetical protein|uniref:hypothetical protein n=1 Tax=Ruminococcus sp. XPD3002 TaxID=1452269 RepID=UPI000917BB3F|nr:hypothetical protein [Ruminococcus sp.]MBR6983655.1 hypothetical protein [Ruminococcus sp.]SFX09881.1 hypothetical protein SAMN04487832_10250 [Ruminococcus flavefaciens]HPY85144.1 hypothetical protein [Ruminococcus flavefaciens]HRU96819.1 hypothetical protein [Ruminococcus sp.]